MLGLLVAVALAPSAQTATRYDMAQRLVAMDYQWTVNPDRARHALAVPHLVKAVNAFFTNGGAVACQELDLARCAAMGATPSTGDAITLRFTPPYAEPKSVAKLHVTWAYTPVDVRPVRVTVGSQTIIATPGRELTIDVRPEQVVPELLQSPEAGVLVPVTVGEQPRSAYLSVVKGLKARATSMLASKQPEAKFLANRVLAQMDATDVDVEKPLIQMVFTAEILDEGRQRLDQLDELPLVHSGATDFRLALPKALKGKVNVPATVVVALHGAGGTEDMFFEALGHGAAVREALSRGWVFIAPRDGASSVSDVLTWLRDRRRLKVSRVLLMGHSLGGMLAVGSVASCSPKPSALALFSPAVRAVPADVPVYLAYGKQDLPMMLPNMQALGSDLRNRSNSRVVELDPCEHLMSPADGIAGAYKFFDSLAAR